MTYEPIGPKSAQELASLASLSPWIVTERMTRFWFGLAFPSAGNDRETRRMVSEKVQASGESIVAMNAAWASTLQTAFWNGWMGRAPSTTGFDDILSAGLMPYSSRVRANRRRLSH